MPVKHAAYVLALAGASLSLWSGAVSAQAPLRSLLRQLYGDLAVEVRTRGEGTLTLGVADGRTSVAFPLMAADVKRWADSASRILVAPAPPRGKSKKWDAVVAGPGVAAGSVSLTRTVAPGDTSIILLVTDPAFQGVRTMLTLVEAKALALAMKRAADASVMRRIAPTPPPRKPPPR